LASRRKEWVARAVTAAIVALAFHAALLTLFAVFGPDVGAPIARSTASTTASPVTTAEDDRPMEIETLVNQLDRPEEKSAEELKREAEKKKEEEDKNPGGQVVDIARPAIEERPDKSNYVAEYDSKVDHETKGAHARDRAGAKEERPDGTHAPTPPSQGGEPPPGRPDAKTGRPGPLAMRELERRNQSSGQAGEIDEARERDGEMPRPGQRAEGAAQVPKPKAPAGDGADGEMLGLGGRPGHTGEPKPNLAPSTDVLQRAIGKGNGSMDYLKDVDDGDSTALNAKKWLHAEFFNRVKKQVAHEWHPEVVYLQHDPQGNVYGVKDRVTVLRVHLKTDGHLASWTLLQSSGVDFLDDEAIHAFQHAQPFPNPPKALVDSDGQIHFNFAFIFELSGRTNFKVYKY
jgi:TonB family protein